MAGDRARRRRAGWSTPLFHFLRAGMAWRRPPHDLPPWQTVYACRRRWRREGDWNMPRSCPTAGGSGAGPAPRPRSSTARRSGPPGKRGCQGP
ncbi:MAG: transposase [Geminicoccaceae bacterium]|nr:transposase [Geminicoccaceae bacterium]